MNPVSTRFVEFYHLLKKNILADRIILGNYDFPSKKNIVNLHWWDSFTEEKRGVFKHNLGDNLSEIIVDYMLARKGLDRNTPTSKTKHLYAVGSIISMGFQNATIWGSGFLQKIHKKDVLFHCHPFRKLDIRAVRGPVTRDLLIKYKHECPAKYGDPAILMPLIYTPHVDKKVDYIIIPHFSNEKYYSEKYGREHIVSMITDDYKDVIDQIVSAKMVISGSLHGIILAETYGIPTVFLRDRGSRKDLKYDDYYGSTMRKDYFSASTIEEALYKGPMPLPTNLDELRKGLLESFPYDLWD